MTAFRGHALVLAGTLSGVVGMGLIFDAAMRANPTDLFTGLPMLILGLWWCGRELARSKEAVAERRNRPLGAGGLKTAVPASRGAAYIQSDKRRIRGFADR